MALLAETLVEEWLNRQGLLTVRGVKEGVDEMDNLAVRAPSDAGEKPEAWHVEVQASFRPNNYIAKLTKRLQKELGKGPSAAIKREPEMVAECVTGWIERKYELPKKVRRREYFWPGLTWRRQLVHAVVKNPEELEEFKRQGIELISLQTVLQDLCPPDRPAFTASAGGDLADLIQFYGRTHQLPVDDEPEDEPEDEIAE
jgi:hypothetical protein